MVTFPHAKINLGLNVTEKRQDGYHNIHACFYPVPLSDALEILPSEQFSYTFSGLSIKGEDKDNLCIKAYQLLKKKFDIPPIQMHLHKVIPMGAGLGGGSADAAFVLKSLNALFDLALSEKELMDFAAALGSDCPFFIQDKPVIASERGNIFEPINLSLASYHLVLINPGIFISTPEAYGAIRPKQPIFDLREVLSLPISSWKDRLFNDFEAVVFEKFAEIGAIKTMLYDLGAEYASMTGSGSSVFGLFRNKLSLENKFPTHYQIWEHVL